MMMHEAATAAAIPPDSLPAGMAHGVPGSSPSPVGSPRSNSADSSVWVLSPVVADAHDEGAEQWMRAPEVWGPNPATATAPPQLLSPSSQGTEVLPPAGAIGGGGGQIFDPTETSPAQSMADSVSATARLWQTSQEVQAVQAQMPASAEYHAHPFPAVDAEYHRSGHFMQQQHVPVHGQHSTWSDPIAQHHAHHPVAYESGEFPPSFKVQMERDMHAQQQAGLGGHHTAVSPLIHDREAQEINKALTFAFAMQHPHLQYHMTPRFQMAPGSADGTMFHHPHVQHGSSEKPAVYVDESLLKPCARALRAFGMAWSQDAMQARSWKAVSRMIDMYTQAHGPEDIVRWYTAMKEYGCEPTKATFDSALEVYSHTGSVEGSVRWLQAMCAVGIQADESTFRWAKRACTRATSVAEAEWCFNSMVECGLVPDVGAFTAVVNVCAHLGDVAGAEKWFSAMHLAGIWPGAIAYNSVINAHAQAKDVAGAERWLAAMEASGILPNDVTFSSVIKACAQAADVPAAERWFEAMIRAGHTPNAVPYNTVLNACARARNVDKAEEWLDKMRAAGIQPDQVSYNVMIKAHGLVGDYVGAEQRFAEMESRGLAHDRKSYSALAMAYANARPVPIDRVDAMVTSLLGRNRTEYLLSHDTVVSVLQCCTLVEPMQPAYAVKWFRSLVPYTHLNDRIEKALARVIGEENAQYEIEALCRSNPNVLKAHNYTSGGASQNFVSKRSQSTGSVSEVASPTWSATSLSGQPTSPLTENEGNSWPSMNRSSSSRLARQQSPSKNSDSTSGSIHPSMSQDVILEVHAPEDLHRYLIGTRGVTMRQIQHESGARIFFPTTRKTPPWAEPSSPDSITIVGSKAATTRAKQLIAVRVADYYTGIGAAVPEPNALTPERETSIAEAHSAFAAVTQFAGVRGSQSSDLSSDSATESLSGTPRDPEAAETGDDLSVTVSGEEGEFPNEAVINACAKHVDQKGVLSWLDVMKETGLWVGRLKPSTCVAITACTSAKDASGVVRWFRAVQKAGGNVNEHTFNLAIKAFAYAGDIRGTESWISAMRRVGFVPNTASFNAVVNRFARAGDVRNAEKWLKLMQGAGSVPGQLTFNSIIQAYTLAADPNGATRWYEAMQAAKVAPNEKTFSSIINAHAQAKKIAGAERWFEEMEQAGFTADVVSYNTVINACAQVRDVQRAVHWLDRMRRAQVEPNQVTYNVMIKAHALSGDTEGAEKWFDEMRGAEFPHNLRSFSSMATAYGQSLSVNLGKVQAMVDEMRSLKLHPDHEVLTSLLKCCAHATPPNPDLAIAWFKEFVPKAHLLAHVERALRQACGNERADEVVTWAKTSCPQATAPRRTHDNRRDNRQNNRRSAGAAPPADIVRKLQFEGEVQ